MTTSVREEAVRGRPSVAGLQVSLERVRHSNRALRERLHAERGELGADVSFLTPRVNAFARIAVELGPEWMQVAWALQRRLERMAARAGSVVL